METASSQPPARKRKLSQSHGNHKSRKSSSIKSFPVQPISRFKAPSPYFRQPTEIGHFSLDAKRCVHCDASLLKVYAPPPDPSRTSFDLRNGYKDFIKRDDDVKERLNNLTTWVMKKKEIISVPTKASGSSGEKDTHEDDKINRLNTNFVMWRGHMTKFLCTPYESREGWAMAVTLFKGTHYISEVETTENRNRRKGMSEREKEMTYWGYKFEQFVTSDDGKTSPDTTKPVNSHEAFCSVIRTRLASHSLLYSGEVDCRLARPCEKPPANYVELKTSRIWYSFNNEKNFFRFKLLKWWAQSFLVGIPEVICGFRDDDGTVHHLRSFKTLGMPDSSKGAWDGAVCLNFADQLLSYIKETVIIDDPRVVYMLERAPGSSEVTCTLHSDGSEKFLSDDYIAAFR